MIIIIIIIVNFLKLTSEFSSTTSVFCPPLLLLGLRGFYLIAIGNNLDSLFVGEFLNP